MADDGRIKMNSTLCQYSGLTFLRLLHFSFMKIIISLVFIVLLAASVFGQARPGVYPWSIKVKIVDDSRQPVNAAKIEVWYMQGEQTEGLTDANGTFSVSKTDRAWELGIDVQKEGYYRSHMDYDLYLPGQFGDQKVATNRNATLTLMLKKTVKPIPMYAKHIEGGPPIFNEPVGYDLEVGDWLGPYGRGVNTDLIFNGKLDQKSKNDFDYALTISFPNQKDGIQEFDLTASDAASTLHSSQNAPTNGYQSQVIRTMSRHSGQGTKEEMYNPKLNYYFRVRTKVDENGNIVSAHYGKIYGDFMQFSYYFNPTVNDRDIEFDPEKNLMTNPKFGEGVNQP